MHKQYMVPWKDHEDLNCINEADFNCEALLQELDRDRVGQNRFKVMQTHEAEINS